MLRLENTEDNQKKNQMKNWDRAGWDSKHTKEKFIKNLGKTKNTQKT